ncbi:polyprenyl synthetase family protein [Leucobacter soli]|uniref:polyprenyl synthetase family protein n=1 Tax=Leucobacter soli TaxID=2812850 RepID=UPI003617B7DE
MGADGGILAGDLMLSCAHQLFARADLPVEQRIRLLDLLEHTVFETTAGEFVDVGLSDGLIGPDLATVLAMTGRKTATYSFELPLRAAAILAGASLELEQRLREAGWYLGLAYQLQDDLLSTFGDAEVHGKDAFSDLREGKQTAIVCFARLCGEWSGIETELSEAAYSIAAAQSVRRRLRACGAEAFVQNLVSDQMTAFRNLLANESEIIPDGVQRVLLALQARLDGRAS